MKRDLFENQNGFQLTIKIDLNYKFNFGYFRTKFLFKFAYTSLLNIQSIA